MTLEMSHQAAADGHAQAAALICPSYPTFNIYSAQARVTTALGPICVATAARELAGWDVEVIDENNYHFGPRTADGKPDHEAIQRCRPADVVGLYGGLTSTIPRLHEIAGLYARMGRTAIAGGQHFVGENIDEALAAGVDGGRPRRGRASDRRAAGRDWPGAKLSEVPGHRRTSTAGRSSTRPTRPPIMDFDVLPIPDFSVLRYAKMGIYPISGVRGCGMDCEFCTVKGKPRFASAGADDGAVRVRLREARRQDRSSSSTTCSARTAATPSSCAVCCADYQDEMAVRFSVTVQIRLDKARDAELLAAMRQANIRALAIGFESPIPAELKAMNKRLNPEDMVELARHLSRAGFHIHGMFIFGYPMPDGVEFHMSAGERIHYFRKFIRKAHIDTLQVLLPVPLPGTELTRRLGEQGRLLSRECVGLEYYDGNFPLIVPDAPLTPESMQAAAGLIMRRFYRPMQMVKVAMNILALPALVFWLHRLRTGWNRWRRGYWKSVYRAGGWLLVRRWSAAFKKDSFMDKLAEAKRRLTHQPWPSENDKSGAEPDAG